MRDFAEEFAKTVAADRRLSILRMLADPQVGGELGESSIEKGLAMWGFRAKLSRELIQDDLLHLQNVQCVRTDVGPKGYMIAQVTPVGRRVAQGLTEVEGVSTPRGL
ncbi:MAG: hypothetical protein AB1942_20080 [Pseudomonadota bacterium]